MRALHPDAAMALQYLLRPFGREVTAAAEARSSVSSAGHAGMRLPLEMAALLAAAARLALPMPAGDEQPRQEVPAYLRTAVAEVVEDARWRSALPDGFVELEVLVRLALMLVAVSDQPRPAAEVYLRRIFELALRRYARSQRYRRTLN